MSPLAARARAHAAGPSPLAAAHFRCVRAPWSPEAPDGHVNLGTAENDLVWDLLRPIFGSLPPMPEKLTHYQEVFGLSDLRHALAGHLGTLLAAPVDPERVVVVAGATGALATLMEVLLDPGEAMLVPTPYFQGFDTAAARAGVRLVPVPAWTREALEAAHAAQPARAVLLSHPHNPWGRPLTPAELDVAVGFAEAHGLPVVSDEIYAGSVWGDAPFESALARAGGRAAVHVVYGLAKDFGLSGLRVGAIAAADDETAMACRALAQFAPVSGLAQHAVLHLLADPARVAAFRAENHRRLAANAAAMRGALEGAGVPVAPGGAGLFLWADLRGWLDAPTAEAELALHTRLLDAARVNVVPGATYRAPEPGFFRLVFSRKPDALAAALDRLVPALAR